MNASSYSKLDEYGLRHMGEHLYRLGPVYYSKLYEISTSQGWYQAHRDLDPSFQPYLNSLDWALQATREDHNGLSVQPLLGLLQSTVRTQAGNIPDQALILLSQLGSFQQARAYADVKTEALAKCELLTGLANTAWKENDLERARQTLEQAESTALEESDLKTRAQALGLVAACAQQIQNQGIYERNIQRLHEVLITRQWPIAEHLRNFDLLEQPDYVLAVLDWDRQNRMKTIISAAFLSDQTIPVIAGTAAQKGDHILLDRIISKQKFSFNTDLAAALTKKGCLDEAMKIVNAQSELGYDTLYLREAMARAAGEEGDVGMVEHIVEAKPATVRNDSKEPAADWEDRIDIVKEWVGEKAEQTLKRAGGSLLGLDWERTMITIAGVEGLLDHNPEAARQLWKGLKQNSSRLGKRIADEFEGFLFRDLGSPGHNSRRLSTKFMNFASKAAEWKIGGKNIWDIEGTGSEEMLAELVGMKAQFGDIQGALTDLEKIIDPGKHSVALLELITGSCHLGQLNQACDLVGKIKHPEPRKRALEIIVNSLDKLEADELRPILTRIFALSRFIGETGRIVNSSSYGTLVESFARERSVSDTINWMRGVGLELNLSALATLSKIAAYQNDLPAASKIPVELEKQLALAAQGDLPASTPPTILRYGADNLQIQQMETLAEIVMHWSDVPGTSTNSWRELARQVYELMKSTMDRSQNLAVKIWCWPALAQALSALRDREALLKLLDDLKKGVNLASTPRDHALVQITIGLTRTGDYLKPGQGRYPEAVEAIHWSHYKALALAEMAEVVQQTPPKQGLFGKGLKADEISWRQIILLDQSKLLLKLRDKYSPTSTFRPILLNKSLTARSSSTFLNSQTSYNSAPPAEVVVDSLSEIASIFARRSMIEEVKQLPSLAGKRDRTPVFLAVLQALSGHGQRTEAMALLKESKINIELSLGNLILAQSGSPQADKALRSTLSILPYLLKNPELFKICIDIMKGHSIAYQARFVQESLHLSNKMSRKENLSVICSLAPMIAPQLEIKDWKHTVERMVAIEKW